MKITLTDKEKADLKLRNNLRFLCNGVRSAWGYGKISNWKDVYSKMGLALPTTVSGSDVVTWEQVKAFLEEQTQQLENQIKNEKHPNTPRNIEVKNYSSVSTDTTVRDSNQKSETTTLPRQETAPRPDTSTVSTPKSQVVIEALDKLTEENDYGFTRSPNESDELNHFWFQKKAITEAMRKIKEGKRGLLVLAGTGTGKTFIVAGIKRRLLDENYHEGKTLSHMPYLSVTRMTVVEQTCRVLKNFYNITPAADVEVINIEQLRAKTGQFWVKEEVKIVGGEEESSWKWKKLIQPCVLFLDESQGAKNKDSTQSKIIYAYNDIPENGVLISISATPFTKVSEAQAFAVSTRRSLEHLGFPAGSILTNENWVAYSKAIAAPAFPDENNEAAIDRLMKDLDDYVVRVKGVRPQFEPENRIERIGLQSLEAKKYYDDAWDRFLKEKAKKEESVDGDKFIFVILLK